MEPAGSPSPPPATRSDTSGNDVWRRVGHWLGLTRMATVTVTGELTTDVMESEYSGPSEGRQWAAIGAGVFVAGMVIFAMRNPEGFKQAMYAMIFAFMPFFIIFFLPFFLSSFMFGGRVGGAIMGGAFSMANAMSSRMGGGGGQSAGAYTFLVDLEDGRSIGCIMHGNLSAPVLMGQHVVMRGRWRRDRMLQVHKMQVYKDAHAQSVSFDVNLKLPWGMRMAQISDAYLRFLGVALVVFGIAVAVS